MARGRAREGACVTNVTRPAIQHRATVCAPKAGARAVSVVAPLSIYNERRQTTQFPPTVALRHWKARIRTLV